MDKTEGFINDRLSSGSELLLSERKSLDIKLGKVALNVTIADFKTGKSNKAGQLSSDFRDEDSLSIQEDV